MYVCTYISGELERVWASSCKFVRNSFELAQPRSNSPKHARIRFKWKELARAGTNSHELALTRKNLQGGGGETKKETEGARDRERKRERARGRERGREGNRRREGNRERKRRRVDYLQDTLPLRAWKYSKRVLSCFLFFSRGGWGGGRGGGRRGRGREKAKEDDVCLWERNDGGDGGGGGGGRGRRWTRGG